MRHSRTCVELTAPYRAIQSWAHRFAVSLLVPLVAGIAAADAVGAVIPVTTTAQKIGGGGGCSLQEAIYSANLDSNRAIAGYSGSTAIEIVTECVPGNGDDIITLPAGAVFSLSKIVDDASNPTGPAATPLITSNITVLAYGATLQRADTSLANFRLFAVGDTGSLTLRRAYVRGFRARGGGGRDGGGGGMGAGGAIYVKRGGLVIDSCAFEGNLALGGHGGTATGFSGGGGGVGGFGGLGQSTGIGGGGGGGARGDGGNAVDGWGGGGGGTVTSAFRAFGGFDCGAEGFVGGFLGCTGGGGFGAIGQSGPLPVLGIDGGRGSSGGGGGGGDVLGGGHGGGGGFGGGGGASGSAGAFGEDGGDGGFGGGGGAGDSGGVAGGDPGDGGFFAGDGSSNGGGGGAGLGGAIFNDSGVVEIRNSTFTANAAEGGFSQETQDGSGGGGAIFSVNGYLAVLNSTVSGNSANFGGGIMIVQDAASAPASFVLLNTIVARNGLYECALSGSSIGVAFTGNLIQNNTVDGSEHHREIFAGCGGVVTTGDPQLGPLQYNQGRTPTMAIAPTSPAWNAADPATSLPDDQRRQDRPAMGAFDIGAFELCLEGVGRLQMPCVILVGAETPASVDLTVQVTPLGAGTTVPAPGTREVDQDSVVALTATPHPGFRFLEWSPNVTAPDDPSTTIFMDSSQTVTASFAACACAVDVSQSVAITRGALTFDAKKRRYIQTVTVTNTSSATITGPISLVLDNLAPEVSLHRPSGSTSLMLPAGSPYVDKKKALAPAQSASFKLEFTNPGTVGFSYDTRVLAGPGAR